MLEVKDGYLKIDVLDILAQLKDDEKMSLVESLSCEDIIIKNVADQICYGCTEQGSSGSEGFTAEAKTPLEKARRQIAENSSEIAKVEINKLKRLVESKEKSAQSGWDAYHQLKREIIGI